MNIKIIIILFLLLSSCTSAQDKNIKDENELKDLIIRAAEAQFKTHNKSILDEIYTSDYMEINSSGNINDRETAINAYESADKNLRDRLKTEIDVDELLIRNYTTFATVIARYNVSYIIDEQPPRIGNVRVSFTCRKESGKWKISLMQLTRIIPPEELMTVKPPPPPPAKKNK